MERERPGYYEGETEEHGGDQGHARDDNEEEEAGRSRQREEPAVEPGPKWRQVGF